MDQAKKPGPPAPEWRDTDALEFELTDIEDARRVLDAESISQFDVASVTPEEYWKKVRRKSLPTDRALTGAAIDWLTSLPPRLRPHRLSRQFPRIVNVLAYEWNDAETCRARFGELLSSNRKGRQGFPPEVQAELLALREWTQPF